MRRMIEAGWQGYRKILVESGAGETQLKETRQAYFSGAAILFQTIMSALDQGEDTEPTDADMALMDDIEKELAEFGQQLDHQFFGAMPPTTREH